MVSLPVIWRLSRHVVRSLSSRGDPQVPLPLPGLDSAAGYGLAKNLENGWKQKITRTGKPTLVFGAGSNGRTLCQRFLIDQSVGFNVVGFADESEMLTDPMRDSAAK